MKVFVVDDEALSIARMQQLLKAFPEIEVIGCSRTAKDAVSGISQLHPDVVFLDVEVGDSTGFEIIDQVSSFGFRPKYIVVSGYSQYAIEALRSRVDDYLLKPVDITELKASLQRVTGRSSLRFMSMDLVVSANLTKRERDVLNLLLMGKSSKIIAGELFLSSHTIDTYRRKILRKFSAKSTAELIGRLK
jgi:DNA-binding NarL/FixJ family response regulator